MKQAREDQQVNPLLAPKPIQGAPDTSTDPEIVTSNAETPAVDAMDRTADPEPAVATGDVAAKVQPSVVPDQTLTISPDDKNINAPMEVIPEEPIPVTPAIAIGPAVSGVRMVPPQTLEEKQQGDRMAEDLNQFKANNEKDIGSDANGNLTEEVRVGKLSPADPEKESEGGSSRFEAVPLDRATPPSFDENQPVNQMPNMRTASRHPFKQASLFRNHDLAMRISSLIASTNADQNALRSAHASAMQAHEDMSWQRYNAATEGVDSVDMPLEAQNFLSRGPMTTHYQLLGANPLQMTFPPSPFESERILGRF
jgi:hypothetical protein